MKVVIKIRKDNKDTWLFQDYESYTKEQVKDMILIQLSRERNYGVDIRAFFLDEILPCKM